MPASCHWLNSFYGIYTCMIQNKEVLPLIETFCVSDRLRVTGFVYRRDFVVLVWCIGETSWY